MARHREDSAKAQAEVDRLLDILRQMENEKNDKDRKISELERSALFTLHRCSVLAFLNNSSPKNEDSEITCSRF